MAISIDTVKYVAHLARISLEPEELNRLSSQLNEIVGFIDKLKTLNTDNVEPTSHILPVNTILRNDSSGNSLSPQEALKNAPQKEQNFFGVPKVIE